MADKSTSWLREYYPEATEQELTQYGSEWAAFVDCMKTQMQEQFDALTEQAYPSSVEVEVNTTL